ncbi:hypothetical protein EW027_11315, partial [Aeribacillus pallidus]
GMPHPEGYRKALRLMKQAFKLIININNYYHSQSRFFTDQKRWLENRSIHMLSIKILFFKKEKAQKLRCALQIG